MGCFQFDRIGLNRKDRPQSCDAFVESGQCALKLTGVGECARSIEKELRSRSSGGADTPVEVFTGRRGVTRRGKNPHAGDQPWRVSGSQRQEAVELFTGFHELTGVEPHAAAGQVDIAAFETLTTVNVKVPGIFLSMRSESNRMSPVPSVVSD